ncbi:MAG: hypothetical protein ABIK28_20285 [Planctomycetota bacterium]
MDKKFIPMMVVFFAVLVLISVFVLLGIEEDGRNALDESVLSQSEAPLPAEADPASAEQKVPLREPIPAEADLSVETVEEMPLSFRNALGGIKGRVVEEDMTPVSRIPVELFGAGLLDAVLNPERIMADL